MRRLVAREDGPTCKSLALSHADACNPLLQAHPTWVQDNTKAAGYPFCLSPFPPFVLRLTATHLGWGTRRQFTRRSRDLPGSKCRHTSFLAFKDNIPFWPKKDNDLQHQSPCPQPHRASGSGLGTASTLSDLAPQVEVLAVERRETSILNIILRVLIMLYHLRCIAVLHMYLLFSNCRIVRQQPKFYHLPLCS
jgi:hypothetical protein